MNYSSLKTAIVGITKNNQQCISQGIKNMIKISNLFNESIVYLYENDSIDSTPQILAEWKKRFPNKFNYTSEKNVRKHNYHTQNIAQARQKALDWVRKNFSGFDLLIILDPDLYYDIDTVGIIDSLNNWNNWDVCFANGIYNHRGMTWDAFAMRLPDQNIPWQGNKNYFSNFHKKANWGTGRVITEWTEVYSAFGGLGLYKSKVIENVNYDINNIDCEHVPFHNKIRRKLEIDPIKDNINKDTTVVYKKDNIYQLALVKEIHRDDYPNLYYTIIIKTPRGVYEKQTTSNYLFTYRNPRLMINPKMIRIYSMREGVTRGYGRSSFR